MRGSIWAAPSATEETLAKSTSDSMITAVALAASRAAPYCRQMLASTKPVPSKAAHPIQRASKVQHAFMQIYPYTEGSGKIARLLSNVILLHHGYQPCIIHAIDRQRYYESLRLPEPQLRELILDAMENGFANGEKFLQLAAAARSKMAR